MGGETFFGDGVTRITPYTVYYGDAVKRPCYVTGFLDYGVIVPALRRSAEHVELERTAARSESEGQCNERQENGKKHREDQNASKAVVALQNLRRAKRAECPSCCPILAHYGRARLPSQGRIITRRARLQYLQHIVGQVGYDEQREISVHWSAGLILGSWIADPGSRIHSKVRL